METETIDSTSKHESDGPTDPTSVINATIVPEAIQTAEVVDASANSISTPDATDGTRAIESIQPTTNEGAEVQASRNQAPELTAQDLDARDEDAVEDYNVDEEEISLEELEAMEKEAANHQGADYAAEQADPELSQAQPSKKKSSFMRKEDGSKRFYLPMSQKKALLHAARWGDVDRLKKLLNQAKAKGTGFQEFINVTDADKGVKWPYKNPQGLTAVMRACSYGHGPVVFLLAQLGADMNVRDKNGSTALLMAVERRLEDAVKILVDNKANVNDARLTDGMTPLAIASQEGLINIAKILIDAGANHQLQNKEGNFPLGLAVKNSHSTIIEMLVAVGANIDAVNIDGDSPLILAVTSKAAPQTCNLLIKLGCKLNVRNAKRMTALDTAVELKKATVERQIIEAVKKRRADELPLIRAQKKLENQRRMEEEETKKLERRLSKEKRKSDAGLKAVP